MRLPPAARVPPRVRKTKPRGRADRLVPAPIPPLLFLRGSVFRIPVRADMTPRKFVFLSLLALTGGSLHAEAVKGVIRSADAKAGTLTLVREDTKAEITGFALS